MRYRYYVSQAVLQNRKALAGSITRASAPDVEQLVLAVVRHQSGASKLSNRDLVALYVERIVLRPRHIEVTIRDLDPASHRLAEAGDDSRANMEDERADGRPQSPGVLTIPWVPAGAKARKGIAFEPAGGSDVRAMAIRKTATFDAFTPENDPHGEHDFGNFELAGRRFFFKIDYYDPSLESGSEDPADPKKTTRVLTLMLAEEY